jgi:hypothetical protein
VVTLTTFSSSWIRSIGRTILSPYLILCQALADSILAIQQDPSHLQLIIPLLELSLKSFVPVSPDSDMNQDQGEEQQMEQLQTLCSKDISHYRRTCQDLYALLIWLSEESKDPHLSLKYLKEYNQPRPSARQFLDPSHPHRQLPGVRAQAWWEESELHLDFLTPLRSHYLLIKEEVLASLRSSLWGPYLDIRLSTNNNWDPHTSWDSIPLYGNGQWDQNHCNYFPVTCSLLKEHERELRPLFDRSNYHRLVGQARLEQDYSEIPTLGIKFYKVWPGSWIKPHMGSPGRLVHSLGLVVPTDPPSTVTVGNVTKDWIEGQFHHFDDSFVHSVDNSHPTETRIVLAFVGIHPDLLSQEGQGAVDQHSEL